MSCAGRTHKGEMRNTYSILVGKPEGKRILGKSSRRCDGNIKMVLNEIECEDVD
jgi:hypothetical protein